MLFFNLVTSLAEELMNKGRIRSARSYQSVCRSVLAFSGKDIPLSRIFSEEWLALYQRYLYGKDMADNTVSFYMRTLRIIYNQAVGLGIAKHTPGLFRHVFTGTASTRKRAVETDVLNLIYHADLSQCPSLGFSRDIFLLSFYLQGISFIDLAYLRKSNLQGEIITYRRRKTGSLITIKLLPQASRIIHSYNEETADIPYLLPIIKIPGKDGRLQYENALRTHNRRLKKLAEMLDIEENLTSYVSRHSWATTAYHHGVPTAIISQAMGHRTEEVTKIYLATFDTSTMDDANRVVLEAVLRQEKTGQENENRSKIKCLSLIRRQTLRYCKNKLFILNAQVFVRKGGIALLKFRHPTYDNCLQYLLLISIYYYIGRLL